MNGFGSKAEQGDPTAFAVLIGDVVESRAIEDRAAFQRRLREVLGEVSRDLGPEALAAGLELTAGDEIQGLFRDPAAVVPAVVRLEEDLYPVRWTHGLGFGPLSTDPAGRVAEMDGPCFHRARQALEEAARAGLWLAARGFGEPVDEAVTALFRLGHALRSRWTEKQALYARAARRSLRKEVAARFGVSPSVVSESLKAAAFDAVRSGEEAAARLLAAAGLPREEAP